MAEIQTTYGDVILGSETLNLPGVQEILIAEGQIATFSFIGEEEALFFVLGGVAYPSAISRTSVFLSESPIIFSGDGSINVIFNNQGIITNITSTIAGINIVDKNTVITPNRGGSDYGLNWLTLGLRVFPYGNSITVNSNPGGSSSTNVGHVFVTNEATFGDLNTVLDSFSGSILERYDESLIIISVLSKVWYNNESTTFTVTNGKFYEIFTISGLDTPNSNELYGSTYTQGDFSVKVLGAAGSYIFEITGPKPEPKPEPEPVPCLTKTCNILTPSGFKNVSDIKQGDEVITSDNQVVKVEKVLTSKASIKPRLIKAHQYGRNLPMIDTFISDYHAYQVNGKWKLPKKANLPQEKINQEDETTYYHLQLPNYYQDNLIVNGLVMEGWDGKMPHELREYLWEKIGNKFVRKLLQY
jgi:hypothetical protein